MPQQRDLSSPSLATPPRVFCKGCGYALVGLESNQCPECGRGFDLGNRRTFARRPPRSALWRWGRRVLALLLLLLLTAGAGVGWLWWGWRAEQPTIARLRGLNARLTFTAIGPKPLQRILGERFGYIGNRVTTVNLLQEPDARIKGVDLKTLRSLNVLGLSVAAAADIDGAAGAQMTTLRKFILNSGWGDHPNLAFLEKMHQLYKLTLFGPGINDAALAHLSGLRQLNELCISHTYVTDAGLKHLQALSALQVLTLPYCGLTDDGLEYLKELKSLRMLDVTNTHVTPAGVAKLKLAIPGLVIIETKKKVPVSPESISFANPLFGSTRPLELPVT